MAILRANRFAREQRLRRRAQFLDVQSGGRKFQTRHFVVLCVLRKDEAAHRDGARKDVAAVRHEALGKDGASLATQPDGATTAPRNRAANIPPEVGALTRLGITVTRKIGNAVQRNRIKRVVREAFRLNAGLFPSRSDVVVIARQGADTLGFNEVVRELRTLTWERPRRAFDRGPL